MKKLNLLFTALLLLCCMGAAKAEKVTIDEIRYDVITKAKQATVIAKENGKYSGSVLIPDTIVYNGVRYNVTSIGDNTFYECYNLTSIEIPNSVTSIGSSAFAYCSKLTSIEIPKSVTSIGKGAFIFCTGLKEVHINDLKLWCGISFYNSYDNIAANPLYYAKNLYLNGELVTELVIPDGVTEIKDYVFYNCTGLTSIEIPNSVTCIGKGAFSNCSGLTSIEIPNSVTSIGDDTFVGCTALTSVVIHNSVTSIVSGAFYGCTSLTSITIPNSITSIGFGAFYGCTGLKNIEIPNSVTSIGGYAFYGCNGLTSITIPNNVTSIECNAFYGCNGLTSITIPNSVTKVDWNAFYGCNGLTSIEIPNSVTSIGSYAFYGCTGLTSIVIPNSVTSIEGGAFENCTGLATVSIGSEVKNIYSEAFAECENLTDVYCLATTVPQTESDAFSGAHTEYTTLHVSAEAIDSYKTTAPWSSFGTIVTLDGEIPEIPETPETPKCANPVIEYSNGELVFECETENAEFITEVTCSDIKKFYSDKIKFSATYNISVYALATGYENSDTVNATLCWIECDCNADDTGIINIPAKAALVTSNGGVLKISCQLDGEEVTVYTTDGVLVAITTIEYGAATVATGLSKGSVAIVKIGNKSIKVIVD